MIIDGYRELVLTFENLIKTLTNNVVSFEQQAPDYLI